MKKMWLIAAIVCAALMVSCGGEKKNEKKDAKDAPTSKTVAPVEAAEAIDVESAPVAANPEVVAMAKELANNYVAAIKVNDKVAETLINEQIFDYYTSLRGADQTLALDTIADITEEALGYRYILSL